MERIVQLVAIAEIIGLGESKLIATGKFESDGTPQILRESASIKPGSIFTAQKAEAAHLIELRAAAPVDSEAGAYAISTAQGAQN